MALATFAPYRPAAGDLPAEAARRAGELLAGPLLAVAGEPLPSALVAGALAEIPAGRAAAADEACRAADGSPSGAAGALHACLVGERHRARVADAARAALDAGFAGVSLDRPDAPLARGLLGAGFCPDCQREFSRRLSRTYGEQFQPIDFLALAREALAQAPGAIDFESLPFGRDFWRFRHEALDLAVRAHARAARDAARAAGRPFAVAAWFEAVGPAQLAAARHLDAAVVPAPASPARALGAARLLRAVMGRRPAALAAGILPASRLAAVAALAGVEVCAGEPEPEVAAGLARTRALARAIAAEGRAPGEASPATELAVLYSTEADLWSAGRHRRAVELAVGVLAERHLQPSVVRAIGDVPAGAVLVLADASALAPLEGREATRWLEGGGAVLSFGTAAVVDDAGRAPSPLFGAARPGGVKVGAGTLAGLPPLSPSGGPEEPIDEPLERALAALLGPGGRAAGVAGRARVRVAVWRRDDAVDVHLAALGAERAQGATLFVGHQLAGAARRARFRSADGGDVSIRLNPSGPSVSTVLPAFGGYAVLSLG